MEVSNTGGATTGVAVTPLEPRPLREAFAAIPQCVVAVCALDAEGAPVGMAADQGESCRALASRTGDRFAGTAWRSTDDGSVLVEGAVLWLDCVVEQEVPAGDHSLVLLRPLWVGSRPDREPLVFHGSQFRRLEELDVA